MNHVYKGYFDTAVGIARRYVKDYDTAKDVAQESMIKVWKKQDKFNPNKATFFTWLFRIVKNTAIDRQRSDTLRIILRDDESGWTYFECPCINLDTIDLETNLNKIEMIPYNELNKRFIAPPTISPFFNVKRIPRKLKKKVKKFCSVHWDGLTDGQRLWYYLGKSNPDYKRFLIKHICDEGK